MKIMRVGVDLAKNVFHVHGVDRNEKPVWRRRLTRGKWLKTLLEKVEPGCDRLPENDLGIRGLRR